jgi:hypothetical protein
MLADDPLPLRQTKGRALVVTQGIKFFWLHSST